MEIRKQEFENQQQEIEENALDQVSGGGRKINSAADDASGLAISDRLRVDVRPRADA